MNKLKVFEAFSGYGSQSIALRNIGVPYEVVAISEIDKYAIKAYEAIHGSVLNLGDISKIKVEDIPKHDLFTYSFPCTDISVAGKQEGIVKGKTRSGLLYECERIIESKRPKYLLLENVKNLVGKKFKPQFDEWLEYLESLGYSNYWKVLNAKDYGVPQNRERVFVVSILGEHKTYEFADKIPLDKCIADILEDEVDEKYYLSEEIQNRLTTMQWELREPKVLRYERTEYGKSIRKQYEKGEIKEKICNMRELKPREDGISNTITTVQKDNYIVESKIICEQRSDEGLRFFKDNVCGTIRTINSGGDKRVIELDRDIKQAECQFRIRKLTPRECFRLMGMNDYDIDKIQQTGISNTQQYKLAGNSIVVNVLEAIFKELLL